MKAKRRGKPKPVGWERWGCVRRGELKFVGDYDAAVLARDVARVALHERMDLIRVRVVPAPNGGRRAR